MKMFFTPFYTAYICCQDTHYGPTSVQDDKICLYDITNSEAQSIPLAKRQNGLSYDFDHGVSAGTALRRQRSAVRECVCARVREIAKGRTHCNAYHLYLRPVGRESLPAGFCGDDERIRGGWTQVAEKAPWEP